MDGRDSAWRNRASRTRKHSEAGYGRPVDRGAWTAKTVKRPRQYPQYANYWAPLTPRPPPPVPRLKQTSVGAFRNAAPLGEGGGVLDAPPPSPFKNALGVALAPKFRAPKAPKPMSFRHNQVVVERSGSLRMVLASFGDRGLGRAFRGAFHGGMGGGGGGRRQVS